MSIHRLVWLALIALVLATAQGWRLQVAQRAAPDTEESLLQPLVGIAAPPGWQLFRLRHYPGVLFIEFPSLAEQGRTLNRLAALVEKAGAPRDRVLSDASLQAYMAAQGEAPATFLYGHDYSARHLRHFFERAQAAGLVLNAQEQHLRRLITALRWWRDDAPDWAVVTTSRAQADDPDTEEDDSFPAELRAVTLRHELSHGVYFVDTAYRQACIDFWLLDLSQAQRQRWRQFNAGQGYDPEDEDLMVNEAQAWLMHTAAPNGLTGAEIEVSSARLEALRAAFRRRAAQTLPWRL